MAMESPFLIFKVECPICRTINEFETIRVGAYSEEGRDTDFCPLNVKWRFPRYQAYNPLVFFTATCSNCFYTREFTNAFKDWKGDNNFKTYRLKIVKDKHLDQLSIADSVVKQMGQNADVNRYPNESAILKLHLAILDEQLADHYSRLDVGRFYLRIGWVFRDMDRNENPSLTTLKGLMHEIDDAHSRVRASTAGCNDHSENLARIIRTHFDSPQLGTDLKAQMLTFSSRYDQELHQLHADIGAVSQRLESLKSLIDTYRATLLGSGGQEQPFGQHASFGNLLQSIRNGWAGIVTNEREALERSVYFYKEAFANGRDIAPGNQQIQASYLIAELSRRIGDYDEARQYFTSTIKAGQEFVHQNRNDQSRIALAKKILELAIEQGRANLKATKTT